MLPGTKVRFTADSLGAYHPDNPRRFVDQVFGRDDTGEVVEMDAAPAMPDWLFVKPDAAPELVVPVHPSMVEEVI